MEKRDKGLPANSSGVTPKGIALAGVGKDGNLTEIPLDVVAEAVASKLNGQLSGLRKDVGELKEMVSANASKIDDLHGWMGTLDGRIADLEEANR